MKISYKVIKEKLPYLGTPEAVAKDLIMHTAEVEEIISQKEDFKNIVFGKITKIESHPDADSLRVCMVDAGEDEDIQIVCGGSNLEVGQGVAVAKLGAVVSWHGEETVTMKKTAIRGVESLGMICASEEIGLAGDYPAKDSKEILDLSFLNVVAGTPLDEALGKDDSVLEIDNKAINHRPDMFSYMGVMRELAVINGIKFDEDYLNYDFSTLDSFKIDNQIPELVKKYSILKVNNVENIESPTNIKQVISAAGVTSKGLLIDVTNYSLYYYGQPAHCFDADKIDGDIVIRLSNKGEKFLGLDDKEYELTGEDIVIADNSKVLALGGIIGGKESAVTDDTKNILIEGATFDQAVIRKTGRLLGVRTDSLNVFEKDLLPEMANCGVSLILSILKENLKSLEVISYGQSYQTKQEIVRISYDLGFINRLIGKNYEDSYVQNILTNLGINLINSELVIPFWRKDLNRKADIAEEIARVDGYDNIDTTVPKINLGSVEQTITYKLKNDVRSFFVSRGWYDMYNYSFVSKALLDKLNLDINECVDLKNYLSEDATHMRNSLIPNLMLSLEKNIKDFSKLDLFEFEKVFLRDKDTINEKYYLSGVTLNYTNEITYYKIQSIVSDLLDTIYVDKYEYKKSGISISYANSGRLANIIVRGQVVGFVGEVHPTISKRFDLSARVGFFEIDIEKLKESVYNKVRAKDISNFQMNNFDLTFLVDKDIEGIGIYNTILNVDKNLIKTVELFDIYEDELKIPGKRSISFKIFIQSEDGTIGDKEKGILIDKIVDKVNKKGGTLR